jgi:hypothetical protein
LSTEAQNVEGGLPNNIMHPTRCMTYFVWRWWPRAGDDERSKE